MSVYLKRLHHWLWEKHRPCTRCRRTLQIITLLLLRVWEEDFRQSAQALAYATLLSIVPLIAVSFSLIKGLGGHYSLEPLLFKLLSPLGDEAGNTVSLLLGFVENIQVGVLGSVGVLFLLYTVMGLFLTIEVAFNQIWRGKRIRHWRRRIVDYFAIAVLAPLLGFAVLSLFSGEWLEKIIVYVPNSFQAILSVLLNNVSSFIMLMLAITLMYLFMTHQRVQVIPALWGGVLTATAWSVLSVIFSAIMSASSNYSGIYSGFAGVVIFMLWLYISWFVVLLGNQLAYFIQYPHQVKRNSFSEPTQPIKLTVYLEPVSEHPTQFTVSRIDHQ